MVVIVDHINTYKTMKALIFSPKKDEVFEAICTFLRKRGHECTDQATQGPFDFSIVLGGDGTVLAAGRSNVPNPVIVINRGHLGFLTSSGSDEYQETLERFFSEKFTVTKRPTLLVDILSKDGFCWRSLNAVNEVVIAKAGMGKLIQVAVYVSDPTNNNEEQLSEYRADGLIVSTPTGSTAYNLSALGPIIHPLCQDYVITPICPQGLTQRPLVIPGQMKVRIEPHDSELWLSVDGQDNYAMNENSVTVQYNNNRSMETMNPKDTYFQILRKKLGWGIKLV